MDVEMDVLCTRQKERKSWTRLQVTTTCSRHDQLTSNQRLFGSYPSIDYFYMIIHDQQILNCKTRSHLFPAAAECRERRTSVNVSFHSHLIQKTNKEGGKTRAWA